MAKFFAYPGLWQIGAESSQVKTSVKSYSGFALKTTF
jgi:hypothetical protein